MKKDTKQTILDEALNLFSINGYEGVTVADIANAVKIKAPSLYKHYKSKQDIFDAIIVEMAERYKRLVTAMQMNGMEAEKDTEIFLNSTNKQLIGMGKELFLYFLHDDYSRKFRRMLTVEQYKNPMASNLYVEQYIDSPIFYQSVLFKAFMEKNTMKNFDVKTAAIHFYAPMFFLLCLCDSCPDREDEALKSIEQHITQFGEIYMESN